MYILVESFFNKEVIAIQNSNNQFSIDNENVDAVNILVKEVVKAIKQKTVNCDITYESVIKDVTSKGYVVLDRSGQERTVQCCIPEITLNKMQRIWLKEPMGNLNKIHICGVVNKCK